MLTSEQWLVIREHYESGRTAGEIVRIVTFGITRQAINQRAKAESWERRILLSDAPKLSAVEIPDDIGADRLMALGILRAGGTHAMAYKTIGIPQSTWSDWLKDPVFRLLCEQVQAETNAPVMARAYQAAKEDPKYAWEWMEKHPSTRDEFAPVQTKTQIGQIKIGHLIQRDPKHRVPHLMDEEEEPEIIEAEVVEVESVVEQQQIECRESVEAVPLVEPIPAQKKLVNRNGVEICQGCGQVPQPGFKHLCMSKRGLPI